MGLFGGWLKMCEFCRYAFWNLEVYKQKNVPGDPISHYYHYETRILCVDNEL